MDPKLEIFWTPTSTTLRIHRRWTGRHHLLIDAFNIFLIFFTLLIYAAFSSPMHIYAAYCTACSAHVVNDSYSCSLDIHAAYFLAAYL